MKKESMQRIVLFSALSVLTGVVLYNYCKTPRVVINEVCSNNFAAVRNENNEYPDYIELYNPGRQTVSLDGCFLSDDEKEPEKYSLEDVSIPAGGYALIWLDKDSAFRISRDGEKLFLTDALHGIYLDQVIVPQLSYDTSYGRQQDGKAEWSVMGTTPGSANEEAPVLPTVSLDKPLFEFTSGFYDYSFALHLYSHNG